MRAFGRDLIRGGHYGQRSCEPHLQAEHMAAPTNAAKREESSCQLGAVHTWRKAVLRNSAAAGPIRLTGRQHCARWVPAICGHRRKETLSDKDNALHDIISVSY